MLCSHPIKDSTFSRLRLNESDPLFHESFSIRLLRISNRVVSKATLTVLLPPCPHLGFPHTAVCQVGETNQGRSSYTTYNDNLPNHAHQVMDFNGGELPSCCILEQVC